MFERPGRLIGKQTAHWEYQRLAVRCHKSLKEVTALTEVQDHRTRFYQSAP